MCRSTRSPAAVATPSAAGIGAARTVGSQRDAGAERSRAGQERPPAATTATTAHPAAARAIDKVELPALAAASQDIDLMAKHAFSSTSSRRNRTRSPATSAISPTCLRGAQLRHTRSTRAQDPRPDSRATWQPQPPPGAQDGVVDRMSGQLLLPLRFAPGCETVRVTVSPPEFTRAVGSGGSPMPRSSGNGWHLRRQRRMRDHDSTRRAPESRDLAVLDRRRVNQRCVRPRINSDRDRAS